MKKLLTLKTGMDVSITLEIDTDILTAETAKQINGFWSGSGAVIQASDGCVFQAVARRAAGPLLLHLLDGYSEEGSVWELADKEGWPSEENIGIKIVDHEIPDFDAVEWQVEELKET